MSTNAKSPQRGEPLTKERLLDAVQQLMLSKGYAATSVDDICRDAGVTKGGFFHHFPSKESAAQAALERFYAATGGMILAAPLPGVTDPLQRLNCRLDILMQVARDPAIPKRCLIGTLTQEVGETHPEILTVCHDLFSRWLLGLEHELAAAKAQRAPDASWSPRSLAQHLLATIQGSLLLAKSGEDESILEQNLLHYRAYLESLFVGAEGGARQQPASAH
jgi:TetR/AcrR family transcriptional repressor of nem operon